MAAATLSESRGVTGASKSPFVFLFLLCLVYSASSLVFRQNMKFQENLLENLQRALADLTRQKIEEKRRDETTSKLLDAASSLTNEDEIETFEFYLQEAVEEANRQKAEDQDRIESALEQIDEQMTTFYSLEILMLALKGNSPHELELQEIFNTAKRIIKKVKTYLYRKKQGLTEKELKKFLKVRNFQQDVHAEL
ncbi:uncharacterized protein PAE49_021790 isoform 1-T2 [Odontesthes bonariensis]